VGIGERRWAIILEKRKDNQMRTVSIRVKVSFNFFTPNDDAFFFLLHTCNASTHSPLTFPCGNSNEIRKLSTVFNKLKLQCLDGDVWEMHKRKHTVMGWE
jgi:hypothetical protein